MLTNTKQLIEYFKDNVNIAIATMDAAKWVTVGGGTNAQTGEHSGRKFQVDTETGKILKGGGASMKGKTFKEAFNDESKMTERQKVGRKIAGAGAQKHGGSERDYRNLGVMKGQADSFAAEYLKSGNIPEGHLRDAISKKEIPVKEKSLNDLKDDIKSKHKLTENQSEKIFNNINKSTKIEPFMSNRDESSDNKYALRLGEGKGFLKLNEKEYQAAKEFKQLLDNKNDTGFYEQYLEDFKYKERWHESKPDTKQDNSLQGRPKFQKERDFLVEGIKKIANPDDFKSEDFAKAGMSFKSHANYKSDLQALKSGSSAGQNLTDNEYKALHKATKQIAEKIADFHKQSKSESTSLTGLKALAEEYGEKPVVKELLTTEKPKKLSITKTPSINTVFEHATKGWNAEKLSDDELAKALMYNRTARQLAYEKGNEEFRNKTPRNKVYILHQSASKDLENKILAEYKKRGLDNKYEFDVNVLPKPEKTQSKPQSNTFTPTHTSSLGEPLQHIEGNVYKDADGFEMEDNYAAKNDLTSKQNKLTLSSTSQSEANNKKEGNIMEKYRENDLTSKQNNENKGTSEKKEKMQATLNRLLKKGILNFWEKNGIKRFYPSKQLEYEVYNKLADEGIYAKFHFDMENEDHPLNTGKSYNYENPSIPLTNEQKKRIVTVVNEKIQELNKIYKGVI